MVQPVYVARGASKAATAILVALVAVSLVITSATNRLAGQALIAAHPQAAWIATAAIPSFLLIAVLFLVLSGQHMLRAPDLSNGNGRYALRLATLWLAAWMGSMGVVALFVGHWATYARGSPAIAAFLLFGPAGEELLFRGLIFDRARRLWPGASGPAIALSTLCFSLHHLELHAWPPTATTYGQLVFTLPMGLVFGLLRARTGSLWPPLLLHILTNLPSAF